MPGRRHRAVWEITLQCNLACIHCGSRAAHARPKELTTAEALDLVHQMADAGIDEVALIGGEAYLRRDWLEIAAEISRCGMLCTMTTGGYGITSKLASQMRDAGIAQCSISVDGLESTHDHLRGRTGSWRRAIDSIKTIAGAGIAATCNTQINRLSMPELADIYETIRYAGAIAWQVQMTVPMGNAADNWEILLQPFELLELFPILGRLAIRGREEGVQLIAGNNVGYYGPFERLLRGGGEYSFWRGCHAGLNSLGVEADGAIKGCPSLPTDAYTGGNIRDRRLKEIILETDELNFNVEKSTDHLWGFCKTCEYSELCRGGCSWTAHTFFRRRGNNPYCHHRALKNLENGVRETICQRRPAGGKPFDYGEFELIVEPVDV